ncbi:MAG: peptidylprolyl isomerase [Alphaproteobacteria bacterium]
MRNFIQRKFFSKNITIISILLSFLLFYSGTAAFAQGIQRIAAIVNDDVISIYDLQARMQVVIISSGISPSHKTKQRLKHQVLRTLIDERLQLQEAKTRNISVSRRNIETAMSVLEKQNNLKPGRFTAFIKAKGLPETAVVERLKAQIAWSKLIRRRLVPRIIISDEEVKEVLDNLEKRKGQIEYRISEIFLPIDSANPESRVKKTAQRLAKELKAGANFAAVARQFSGVASGSVGGDMGWLHESALNDKLALTVSKMKQGGITNPIRIPSGFQIYRLAEKRKILEPKLDKTIVELRRIKLPLRDKPSQEDVQLQMELAKLLSKNIEGCDDMVPMAKQAKASGKVLLGKMEIGKLGKPLRGIIRGLELGTASRPIRTPSGVSVFMVCNKSTPKTELPTAQQIRAQLKRERLSVLIRRYMRDLRSAAAVDIRIY